MINHVPSSTTSLEVLRLAQDENPNPTPVLAELFKRCEKELSDDPQPVGVHNGRKVNRASVR